METSAPPQGSSNPPEGGNPLPPPEEFKDYFVTMCVKIWKSKQEKIPMKEMAIAMAGMCHDPAYLGKKQAGCLLPDPKGGYVFVPYNEEISSLSADLMKQVVDLTNFANNPGSTGLMAQTNKLMEDEIDEKCVFEFLDGGDASQLDFMGKVKMLAKHRLMKEGIDVSPNDPPAPQFRFAMTDITDTGLVKMRWNHLNWTCTAETILSNLEQFSQPTYHPKDTLDRQLRELAVIHQPLDAAEEARDLAMELTTMKPVQGEPDWAYIMSHSSEKGQEEYVEERPWSPLRSHECIKLMKRLAREQGKWPVVMRTWQLRHYKNWQRIRYLQQRQLFYCQVVEARRQA